MTSGTHHNRNKETVIKLAWTQVKVARNSTSKITFQRAFEKSEGRWKKTIAGMDLKNR